VLKFTVSKSESRSIRAVAKQIGRSRDDVTQALENWCELREETNRRLEVTCELLPFPKWNSSRILKAVVKGLKPLFVRLLVWFHFPLTH
jgi:hypothetical protein